MSKLPYVFLIYLHIVSSQGRVFLIADRERSSAQTWMRLRQRLKNKFGIDSDSDFLPLGEIPTPESGYIMGYDVRNAVIEIHVPKTLVAAS